MGRRFIIIIIYYYCFKEPAAWRKCNATTAGDEDELMELVVFGDDGELEIIIEATIGTLEPKEWIEPLER